MGSSVRISVDSGAVRRMLLGAGGPVVQEVERVTERVAARARVEAPGSGPLTASIRSRVRPQGREVVGVVYSDLEYSRYVQEGTGVYGPARRPIRPRRASVLVFTGRSGGTVFAREVRGQPANQFMLRALRSASPWPVRERGRGR